MQHSGSLAIPCLPIRLILMARLARMGSTRRHVRPRRERQPTTIQQHEDARVWFLLAVSSAGSGSLPRTALPTTPASTPQPTVFCQRGCRPTSRPKCNLTYTQTSTAERVLPGLIGTWGPWHTGLTDGPSGFPCAPRRGRHPRLYCTLQIRTCGLSETIP